MILATEDPDQALGSRYKIDTNVLDYKYVANWPKLNRPLLEGKIECSICYSFIFYHESLQNRIGPLAFQCNMCQSNLICEKCTKKLSVCPFCRREESCIEPASEIILKEIKKMEFHCQFSLDGRCSEKLPMSPKALLKHYS